MTNEKPAEREIIYVGDPMCSWCWGFAPVARKLAEQFGDRAPVRLVLGGLRPGKRAAVLDAELKKTIRPHWERVQQMTGQAFDYSIFDREGFLYDTEPACRAIVYVRGKSRVQSLPAFLALQDAFYARGVDITQVDSIATVLADQGLDGEAFRASFEDPVLSQHTYADFTVAERLGAQGFPTVFLRDGDNIALLTMGYQPYDVLAPAVERYFSAD
jgi:putative protein-disulfide isomerase